MKPNFDGNPKHTALETGHVVSHCVHGREYCPICCFDFREMNAESRMQSEVDLSKRQAKRDQKRVRDGPCAVEGCKNTGSRLCGRCRNVGYCSVECQRRDWKDRHKKKCKKSLPSFVDSTGKKIATYPIGTTIDIVGSTQELRAKIRKFHPPGTAEGSDSLFSDMAMYSIQVVGGSNDAFLELCEDVHNKECWRKVVD
ncbi:unnamed protein product [Pseudo-nitzschia multistriata]|uniref:MYND-type domain-containing protein n=1 Tax=Pseudo-nitzschia multistriata TaxID=183589 RepID=A0A448Z022_9STRA|nr:unnamed protein product [Pseudo-nitzschia multistriata]